jgi:trans-aconitate 2-methyltransferase
MSWDPAQYLKFGNQRLRPALDLLAQIPLDAPAAAVDLGCGPGNVTRFIAQRWPGARVTGVDNSADMLAQARVALPQADWVESGIGAWAPDHPVDLIYSNAALHWLPDHRRLLERLLGFLNPGGVLAVQMPRNFGAPSHTLIADTVRAGPWHAHLEPLLAPSPVADPAFYYDLLSPRVARLDIWETEYLQVLDGPDPVKEWTKGTWLKQFLDALDEPQRAAFEADYARRLREPYPMRADGKTLFPFRRLFIVAVAR